MKKIFLAALLMGLTTSVFAVETGESTYVHTGNAKFSNSPRQRVIPAPSAWTPPERIPTKPVQAYVRDQPKRLGGGFASPAFSNPSFANPSFANPGFANPGFANPGFANPGFANPGFANPGFGNPGFANPGFANPNFANPGYSQ